MSNPLLELQPNKVSKDLSSYITYIYGSPKCGKSTFAAQFPNALFITTEPTNRAIPGIISQEVDNWSGIKKVVRLLKDQEVKDKFKTVIFDTIDLAADFCERYICDQNGVDRIGDIPWGSGYGLVEREFERTLRAIRNEHYGLVLISHVKEGTFTNEDGIEYNKLVPAVSSKKCLGVAENFADIYGWAHVRKFEDGTSRTVLTIRQENNSVSGGNHFKYIEPEIELSYTALEKAVREALDKEEQMVGAQYFTEEKNDFIETEYNFDELMGTFQDLVDKIQATTGAEFDTKWAPHIASIVEKYLGKGKKVSNITPTQVEQLDLIVQDLISEVNNGL